MQLSISGKSWAARKGHVAANFSETQQHLCAIQELTVINKKKITKIAREKKNLPIYLHTKSHGGERADF